MEIISDLIFYLGTRIEGQSRTSDDLPDRPLRIRHEQKVAKYARSSIAERNGIQFAPAVFLRLDKFMVLLKV